MEQKVILCFNNIEGAAADYARMNDFSEEDIEQRCLEYKFKFINDHEKILKKMTSQFVNGRKLDKSGYNVACFLLNKYKDSLRYGFPYVYPHISDLLKEVAEAYGDPSKGIRSQATKWSKETKDNLIGLGIIEFSDDESALKKSINDGREVCRFRFRSLYHYEGHLK